MAASQELDEDTLRERVAAVEECGGIKPAARKLGIEPSTLRHSLKQAAKRGLMGYAPTLPGFEVSRTTTVLNEDQNVVRQFVTQRPERVEEEFVMPEGMTLDKATYQVGPNGTVERAWLKPKRETDHVDIAAMMERVLAGREGTSALYPPPAEIDARTFTVIPLVDWHIGLMAWARETGENYDLKIARDTIMKAMAKVIHYSPPSERCIILGLGDMLHFDGFEPITSRSHNFLDSDGRYPKVLDTAADMIVDTIDMAQQKYAKVDVRILPGNHDDKATVALNLGFRLLYRNNERITFDNDPSRYWWHREGKVFLGATHGDKAKMKDLPLVMAHDRPQDWAKSTYRRIYTGHVHHESTIEEGGVLVTSMRSPVAKDAYHFFNKWRSGRSMYSDTYDVDGSSASSFKINI